MDFISPKIIDYALGHSDTEPAYLRDLYRETYLKHLLPRMISGPLQGRILAALSKMIQPKRILEIGTYTGYSALCLAEGLDKSGMLYTIDNNEELGSIQLKYFKKAGLDKLIKPLYGDALKIIEELDEVWDIVFIDADKREYLAYFDSAINKVKKGGYVIADNVLWSGKVLEELNDKDEETKAIARFNESIHMDPRVENVLLPVRDGLMLIRKK